MSKAVRQFKDQGYCQLSACLDESVIDSLRRWIMHDGARLTGASSLNRDGLTFYSNLYREVDPLADLLCSAPWIPIIEQIALDKLWLRWDQAVIKEQGGKPFPWHRDNAYNKLKKEHFQVWVAVTEMTAENGSLWVIPKSHKLKELQHRRDKSHWLAEVDETKAQCISAKPGDVIIFSSKLLHKTEVNETHKPRVAYVAEYMKQSDFDPKALSPYCFVADGPKWLDKHPAENWWTRKFSTKKPKNQKLDI